MKTQLFTLALTSAFCSALILSVALPISLAQANTCTLSNAPPKLSIKVKKGRLKFNFKKSSRQLKALKSKGSSRSTSSHKKATVRGLTSMVLRYQTSFKYEYQKINAQSYCVRATEVEVNLGYNEIMVYIAKKYRRGSCQYNAIMKHEMRHVSANREGLNRYKKKIISELKQAVAASQIIVTKYPKKAQKLIQSKINQKPMKTYNKISKRMTKSNNAIDTPKSYKRVAQMCKNW